MKRHRYDKDPDRDGMCRCGQGRSEDVHRVLTWRKARTGNWLSDWVRSGVYYRCRENAGKWIPEVAQNPSWITLARPSTLTMAKAECEQHREAHDGAK
jgi:hypothetical protein